MFTTCFGAVKKWHKFKYEFNGRVLECVKVSDSECGVIGIVYNAVDLTGNKPMYFAYQHNVFVDDKVEIVNQTLPKEI